jgi:glucosyl-dolichyl phosphate glucuronosyltransferase
MTTAASIIICTLNRARDLAATLQTMGSIDVPDWCPTELIVVDNGSTDATAQVAREFFAENFVTKYLYVPARGKALALNEALRLASGQVLVFTDDDVRPPRNWVAAMCGPILAGKCDGIAGGVRLAPQLERPWLTSTHRAMLASTETIASEPEARWVGANMAMHRRVFEVVPGFDVELGPGAMGYFDETLLFKQVRAAGFVVEADFSTCVEHHFDPTRLGRRNFVRAAIKMGEGDGYVSYHWAHRAVERPLLNFLSSVAWLGLRYLRHSPDIILQRPVNEWELLSWRAVGFAYFNLREGASARKYDRCGFCKRRGRGAQASSYLCE